LFWPERFATTLQETAMQFSFSVLGFAFEIASRLPRALYINAGPYQFAYDRNFSFERADGSWGNWVLEKQSNA